MISGIYINMSVTDLERSRNFFTGLGLTFNPQFTNDHGACLLVSPNISVMLVNESKFQELAKKPIAHRSSAEMILSLECDSPDEIRKIAETAFGLGARRVNDFEENDFMVSWAFEDPDGHLWDLFWMDTDKLPK
jgi:predicted lactoylglutathione lyase